MNTNKRAFPTPQFYDEKLVGCLDGMTERLYLACHAPAPTDADIKSVMNREQVANPHNDYGPRKPPRRSAQEIEIALRFRWADMMMAASDKPTRTFNLMCDDEV